jgi:hypothetical protein
MNNETIETILIALNFQQIKQERMVATCEEHLISYWQGQFNKTCRAIAQAHELPAMARALRNIAQIEELVEGGADGAPDATDYGSICNQVHGLCHAY